VATGAEAVPVELPPAGVGTGVEPYTEAPKQTQRCGEETEAVVHKVEKRGETLQE